VGGGRGGLTLPIGTSSKIRFVSESIPYCLRLPPTATGSPPTLTRLPAIADGEVKYLGTHISIGRTHIIVKNP